MSSSTLTPKRRREDDAEENSPADKRARREAAPHGRTPTTNGNLRAQPSAPVEYQPGAIRRVKLTNFITYRSVEFFPGPSLNMVIGPNGTGKSTLVCAICIGFGYEPKYLGRADKLADFVKHGAQKAYIEIEVERPLSRKEGRNPVFKCMIRREGNKADYNIDGKTYSMRQVKEKAHRLGIQVDNLCQFLPQDRVVGFAGMTPVELLNQTQRAIASREMNQWHEELKKTRKDQRNIEGTRKDLAENLTNLEAKHRMQEADVQRIRERDEVQASLETLNGVVPYVRYADAKKAYEAKKTDYETANEEYQQLQASLEPYIQELKAKERYKQGIQAGKVRQATGLDQAFEAVTQKSQAIAAIDQRIESIQNQRESSKKTAKTSEQELQRLAGIIRNLKAEKAEPEPVTAADIEAKSEELRDCERQKIDIEDDRNRDRQRQNQIKEDTRTRNQRIDWHTREINNLQSKTGQQEQKLKSQFPDAWKAWQWVQKNRHLFEKQVYGPPMIECSVREQRFADMVEAALPKNDLQAFTCQSMNDFKLLSRSLRELNLSRVNQRSAQVPLAAYRERADPRILEEFGLDGWILDLMDGPEPVLASLCEGAKIHLTGYCSQDLSNRQFENLQNSDLTRIVTPKTLFTFQRRREYGPGATNVVSRDVVRAKCWTDAPVDTSALSGHRQAINELNHEIEGLMAESKHLAKDKAGEDSTKRNEVDDQIRSLKAAKQELVKQRQRYISLDTRISYAQGELDSHQQTVNEYRAKDKEFSRKSDECTLDRAQLSLAYAEKAEKAQTAYDKYQDFEIMLIEAISDYGNLKDRNTEFETQLGAKEQQRDQVHQEQEMLREEATTTGQEVHTLWRAARREERAKIKELKERFDDLAALKDEIDAEQARFDLMQGDNHGNTLRDYERREAQITDIKGKLEQYDESLHEMSQNISEIRGQWEPQLEALIDKVSHSFSYNMSQINCAGEVGIHKDEDDFDQWALKVMVKFRDNEPLTQLDSHRQSGGERAVSTTFYLMSLQTLTMSPFRVVDEINQGMDPRNERLVHARMVAIATGTDDMPAPTLRMPRGVLDEDDEDEDGVDGADGTQEDVEEEEEEEDEADSVTDDPNRTRISQYFLITPKLLPNLVYERGMRVLCIASGNHMPASDEKAVDFGQQLEARRRMLATAAG